MKRTSKVRVNFKDGNYAQAVVTTFTNGGLTRSEAQSAHDDATDNVVGAIRSLNYLGSAPLRAVSIQ